LLGVYDFIEQNKTAAASVTDGHCFVVRLTDNKFESVDNEGRVCNLLHTDKGSFRLEDFDFESKTSVFLMVYMHGAMEFKK
jgi:hypothetical protein